MNDYNIKKLYEEMEIELIASMQRNYARHLNEENTIGFEYSQWQSEKLKELKRYQRQNKSIIGDYTKGLSKKISEHMQKELKQGAIDSIKKYNRLFPNDKKNIKKILNKSFFKINDRKVNNLIKAVNNDLKTANTAVLRMANDQYRQVIHKSAFFVANGVFTEKQAANMATKELTGVQKTKLAIDEASKDFLSRGFNCIEYKDGRRVNIASYSQMAVRTASLRAQLMGEGDFRKSIGRVLVRSTSHGGACPICQKWESKIFIDDVYSGGTKKDGKYMLLSEAMKQGFLHPNCRHGLTTYYPELEGISYDKDEDYELLEENQSQYNYYDRQEKKFNRLRTGSIDYNNRKEYRQKALACEMQKDILVVEQEMPYEDVTNKIIKKATPNDNVIPEISKYLKFNSKNALFDTKDITDIERITLKKIQNKIGGQFNIIHRVQAKGVRTPDAEYYNKLLHTNKRYYDVKAPKKSSNIKSKGHKITHVFDQAKGQTKNIIISLLRDECDLTNIEAAHQITKALNKPDYLWIDRVILVGKNDYIKIYIKK